MKHPKILLFLGIWFLIIPITGIPLAFKKILLVVPALFLIAMAITQLRSDRGVHKQFSEEHDELIKEIAGEIAEDIVEQANVETAQEVRKLRDIL